MHILYITPSFQHPTMRGPTRCYQFVRDLSRRNHSITLLSLTRFDVPQSALDEMKRYTDAIQLVRLPRQKTGPGPLSRVTHQLRKRAVHKAAIDSMRLAARRLTEQGNFDLVIFHGKLEFPVIEKIRGIPIVIDVCDATSTRIFEDLRYASWERRLPLLLSYVRMRAIEAKIRKKTPYLAFISARDRDAILSARTLQEPGARGVRIVPGGVDIDFWTRKADARQPETLVFAGVMDYRPNEDAALYFLEQILPLVRTRVPGARFTIVGRNPSSLLVRRASGQPNVSVTGSVPDVRPYLEEATLAVAPLRFAAGVQNKVLEAMSMEVPVIVTPIVAEGLSVNRDRAPVIVGRGAQGFADSVIALLADAAQQRALADEGRRFVEAYFRPAKCAQELEKLCLLALTEAGGRERKSKTPAECVSTES